MASNKLIIKKHLEQGYEHSTLVGKLWIRLFFVVRLLLVVFIAGTVFGDEQAFKCNTQTPGCSITCLNDFSPISLSRLWALQSLSVSLPTVVFMVYSTHKISQVKKMRQQEQHKKKKRQKKLEVMRKRAMEDIVKREESGRPEHVNLEDAPIFVDEMVADRDKEEDKVFPTKLNSDTTSHICLAYVAQVFVRLVIEIGFMVLQFNIYVFKFWVPELFKCARWPCPNVVNCTVPRPKEKTMMIWVIFGISSVMVLLNIIELFSLGIRKITKAHKQRSQNNKKENMTFKNLYHFTGHKGQYGGARNPRG